MNSELNNTFKIFDHLPIGVFILRKGFTVVYWNKIIESYSGIKAQDIEGKKILDFYPNLKQKRYYDRINNIFNGAPPTIFSPQLHKYIIPCELKDGKFRVQNTTVVPMRDEENNSYYAVFSIQDLTEETRVINDYKEMRDKAFFEISERKKAEEKLKVFIGELEESKKLLEENSKQLKELNEKLTESENKLKETNMKKDKFFSIIAHDLKSPFLGLMGYSELLTNDLDELDRNQIKTFAHDINKIAKNLFNFISNLLEWSRLQTNKLDYQPKKINVKEAVADTINIIFLNAARKNITLINDTDEQFFVCADHNMLYSVLQNLIANAIKFSNSGGKVTVSAQLKDGFVEISIEDTGIGINSIQLEKLFRIDTQYSRKGTADEHGTGLGLVLCKELIERHSGKIWVESVVDKGSKFTFALPACQEN